MPRISIESINKVTDMLNLWAQTEIMGIPDKTCAQY